MLKKTETEETIGFNVTFLALMAFEWGGGNLPAPLPLAMPITGVAKIMTFIAQES